jgi:endonuclease/exonuclease/phosphatase family metal-dependent hydrolase
MKVALAGLVAVAATACSGETPRDENAAAPDAIRVLAYNIHHGEGMDELLDLDRIAALIREVDPDLVALQEIDSVTARTERVDQAQELGRLTGMNALFGSFMPYDGGAYGMAILSRWPIGESTNIRLPDGEEPRTSLAVTVELPESRRILRFVGIHFYRTAEERLAQATNLGDALGNGDVPTILAGDFNSTPDSEVMAYLSDSWTILEKGEDHLTFSSLDPVREIDFVIFRPAGRFEMLRQVVRDEPVASDHRPVLVDLVLRD